MNSTITLEFLQNLFGKFYPKLKIINYEESPGSERGDNYTSLLYRIKLKGFIDNASWEKSVIYKCLPNNTTRREAFKSEQLFKNEVAFYTRVLPLFQKFQESKTLTKFFQCVPQCFYAVDDTIILEDLCMRSFKMVDRKQGLSLKEMVAVLNELAVFHGLSLALKITKPEEFHSLIGNDGIHEGMFLKENEDWYREYYKHAKQNALDMVKEELVSYDRKYIERFEKFVDDSFFSRMVGLVSYIEPLSVLCHGDCWTNNILFKNKELKLQVCFIDFQLCRYGSLALDLANLIYCCTTKLFRDSYLDDMLVMYHENLHKTLVSLLRNTGYENNNLTNNNYLLELIHKEFRRCSLFGLGLAIDMIPISTCDSEQAPDMYEEENKDTMHVPVATSNEICKIKMSNLVLELVDNNILN